MYQCRAELGVRGVGVAVLARREHARVHQLQLADVLVRVRRERKAVEMEGDGGGVCGVRERG